MKYERNLSNGIKKTYLLIVLFAFLVFNPLAVSAAVEVPEYSPDVGTSDRLDRYIQSVDKIVEVFDVQTTTVLPNLDKIGDAEKDILIAKIAAYNNFANNFADSIYEDQDTTGLFTQILGDYRFLRKVTYHIRRLNTLAQNLDTAYTLINSTETYIKDNGISDSDLTSSLAENEGQLDNLFTSMSASISGIFTIVSEMELDEYSTAIDLLEAEKENYNDFVVSYDGITDEIINNAEEAIGEVNSVNPLIEECEEGGGKWDGEECICENGTWDEVNKECISEEQLIKECENGGGEWTGKECICENGDWDDVNKECISEEQLIEECEEGGGKWDEKISACVCEKGDWDDIKKICR